MLSSKIWEEKDRGGGETGIEYMTPDFKKYETEM